MPVTLIGKIVPKRMVLDAAVVPESDRVWLPLEPRTEFRRLDMPVKHLKDRGALALLEAHDSSCEDAVDEEALLSSDWMGPNNGVFGPGVCLTRVVNIITRTIDMFAIVNGYHTFEHLLDRLR